MTKDSIITLVQEGFCVSIMEDIACYKTADNFFVVDYWPSDGVTEFFGLTKKQEELLQEEGELSEYFDKIEDAVEFFLQLKEANADIAKREFINTRKTIREKMVENNLK